MLSQWFATMIGFFIKAPPTQSEISRHIMESKPLPRIVYTQSYRLRKGKSDSFVFNQPKE